MAPPRGEDARRAPLRGGRGATAQTAHTREAPCPWRPLFPWSWGKAATDTPICLAAQAAALASAAPAPTPPGPQVAIAPVGLTACRGDGARDTVENTPMIVCVHACGGTDGARHAPNDLPRRVSGL